VANVDRTGLFFTVYIGHLDRSRSPEAIFLKKERLGAIFAPRHQLSRAQILTRRELFCRRKNGLKNWPRIYCLFFSEKNQLESKLTPVIRQPIL
jgi:hypothetical protein